jgi:undecaprenyl-diphosphatase
MRSRSVQPLLAETVRPWAVGLLACCALLVAALGVLFAHQSHADGLDHAVDSWVVHQLSGHHQLLLWLAAPATLIPAGLVSLIMVAACLLTGRRGGAVLAATAVPATAALNDAVIKPLVHRTVLGHPAYPSGHVASILAVTATLAVLLALPPQRPVARAVRLLILMAAGVLACGVAVAVIGLRWHYFTDTVGGAAVGTGTVCALALILDLPAVNGRLGSERRRVRTDPLVGDRRPGDRDNPDEAVQPREVTRIGGEQRQALRDRGRCDHQVRDPLARLAAVRDDSSRHPTEQTRRLSIERHRIELALSPLQDLQPPRAFGVLVVSILLVIATDLMRAS